MPWDKRTPVCKAVLDVLKHNFKFMVVLTDEYLTSQMCHDCHNKLIPRKGESCEKYCTHCEYVVDRDIKAAMNILQVFLFHVRGWGRLITCAIPTRRLQVAKAEM
jgi:transposase